MSKLDRPIIVADYDPAWPKLYETERSKVKSLLGERAIEVEHIGSTAVLGLAAKPVVDIAIAINRLDDAGPIIKELEQVDYEYVPEFEAVLPNRRFLWKGTPEVHTVHIHMTEPGDLLWRNPIAFRDYLRSHPDEASQYADLKRRLATECGTDLAAYVAGKTEFVEAILAKTTAFTTPPASSP